MVLMAFSRFSAQARRRVSIAGAIRGRVGLLALLVLGYVAVAAYQLGLPGLHYDEAKEAGLNALELLNGAPLTAFRAATVSLGPWSLPLMVQDYIGALNVYLVMPFLALSGVGVPNIRWPAIFLGALTLLLLERVVSEWWAWQREKSISLEHVVPGEAAAPASNSLRTPVAWAGLLSVALLALSPSFVFWSRQGIFVTNLTQPLCLFAIWQGVRWLRRGEPGAFVWTGFGAGLALYAKLTAGWLLGPFALFAFLAYLRRWAARRGAARQGVARQGTARQEAAADSSQLGKPVLSLPLLLAGMMAFLVALSPLILFNVQTGGTWAQLSDNLSESYYGVDNRAWLENLGVRVEQLVQTLRGDHFWYLGGIYGNGVAPWLALVGAAAVAVRPRWIGPPLLLLLAAVGLSVFTISDLFITHYALLQPVLAGTAGLGLATWFVVGFEHAKQTAGSEIAARRRGRIVRTSAVVVIALWLGLDGYATARYHGALARSGGLSDHSDATYHFAYYLRYNGMGAPIALDWGMDAPVRFLTENAVRPLEVFGYASPAVPDDDFEMRLAQFLDNPQNVYVLRSPEQTVFAGRREAFLDQVAALGRTPVQVETFRQRDGAPLFEVWRVE